ncbi:MAG: amidohydrolase family protein, partial [Silvibacterium sp.]
MTDNVHANHPPAPFPAKGRDADTPRQRGSLLDAKTAPQGVTIAREFTAVLVSPFSLYRYDASYALDVYRAYPGRFGLVKSVNPNDLEVVEIVENWAATPGTVGIRLMLAHGTPLGPDHAGTQRLLVAAARVGLPVNLFCWGCLDQAQVLIAHNPGTMFVIDHLGLPQPFGPPVPAAPWADLPKLLEFARLDNVTVKISGACTLSHESFPYGDIWDPLGRIFDAFGLTRCLWGTDWT